jgi:hypothetical protein
VNVIRDISHDCIPVLNLDEDHVAAEPVEEIYEATLLTAATQEDFSEPAEEPEASAVTPDAKKYQKELEQILENKSDATRSLT